MSTPFPHSPTNAPLVCPVSLTSQWVTALTAGTVATQDGSSGVVTDPDSLSKTTHIRLSRENQLGSVILARLGYDDGLTGITDPVLVCFGRTGIRAADGSVTYDEWQLLPTMEDTPAFESTLTTDATDVTDGTLLYTTPDRKANAWDCMGCNEFVFAVKTALSGTGTVTNAIVQAKII